MPNSATGFHEWLSLSHYFCEDSKYESQVRDVAEWIYKHYIQFFFFFYKLSPHIKCRERLIPNDVRLMWLNKCRFVLGPV